jgi:hypothetical protein
MWCGSEYQRTISIMERILAVTFAASDALKLQAAAEMFLSRKLRVDALLSANY